MQAIQEQLAVKFTPDLLTEYNTPDRSFVFLFPQGIIGFSDLKSFILLPIEKEEYTEFRRLQNLDDINLAFFLYNLKEKNNLISSEDLKQAATDLCLPYEMTEIYGICTLKKTADNRCEFYINLRAPLILDKNSNKAYQYIYLGKDFDFKHFLGVY